MAALALLWGTFGAAVAPPASAAIFTVNSVADLEDAVPGDGVCASTPLPNVCSLRAAIQEANAKPDADTIELPSQEFVTYRITLMGAGEDDARSGDFDITEDLTIIGTGLTRVVTIDGRSLDRVFDIFAPANVTIRDVVVRGGFAQAAGAGIRNSGTLQLENVTVESNTAQTGAGGGVANLPGGILTILNSTISGNQSAPNGQGGGVANIGVGLVTLDNVTINNNGATAGGGIYNLGELRLRNTIVANSTTGTNCVGTRIVSLGHNIDSGTTCLLDQPTDKSNTNPQLSPLAWNGGYSRTHAVVAGSPAIDMGDNANCPSTDQRGFPRPTDGNGDMTAVCDIGAFELNPPTPTATITQTFTPTVLTATPTMTISATPTIPSPTPTITATPTNTKPSTQTPTPEDTATATNTPSSTATATITPTGTATATPSPTRTATETGTATRTPTATDTPTITQTPTRTGTPTRTDTPTRTPTTSATPTWTIPGPTATRTNTSPPTLTPTRTPTLSTPTATLSAVRWGVAGNILIAWVLTIPAAAIVAAACYWPIQGIF